MFVSDRRRRTEMEENMKKITILFITIFSVCTMLLMNSYAATFSKTKSTTVSLHGTFKLSEKATYDESGTTRWSFTNALLTPTSSVNLKSYYINTKTTSSTTVNNFVYTAKRKYTAVSVDYSYNQKNASTTLTWVFDDKTNTWK